MPVVSSIFLVAALVLAVVVGPQTRSWPWGPAMVALGLAVAAALPAIWNRRKLTSDFALIGFGTMVAGWFGWRAWHSPVAELGQADLMLLAAVVGTFVSIRAIEGNPVSEKIVIWGTALLLLANVVVIGIQVVDPNFSPVFRARAADFPSGFYAHYNEAANYLIASSLLVAAAALFGRHATATRILWWLIAIAGLIAVYFTRSRGGILGAAVGGGVFAGLALVLGKRTGARWFSPALIATPLVGCLIVAFLLYGWQGSQEHRNAGVKIDEVLDSNYRLFFLGLAISCVLLHPLAGGGSRSFSWECFQFYDVAVHGTAITHKPELVHNELLQAATDYGIIGAGLLTGFLITLAIVAIIRILFSENPRDADTGDVWRLAGLAALAGMFVQSCFSFVFHLLPGAILLGICLGQISRSSAQPGKSPQTVGSKFLLSLAALSCVVLLLPAGWKSSQATRVLWPSYFSKDYGGTDESKIDALTEAIRILPLAAFYQDRAAIHQKIASELPVKDFPEAAGRVIDDYQEEERLHPYDPEPVINRANLLSRLNRDSEAEEAFGRAIRLQGRMEVAYQGHLSLSKHLLQKGIRQFDASDPSPSLATMEVAAQEMEQSAGELRSTILNVYEDRITVHENLGAVREANGDYQGAMMAYDFASKLLYGTRANYRAGVLYCKLASSAWAARRSSEALGYFIEAKKRIEMAGEQLPSGATPSQRLEYLAYLDKTINFLKGAKIEPALPPSP